VGEGPSVYRPRNPERTPLWKLFDEHYLDFTRIHEERFEHEDGALRAVVTKTVTAFLDCGVVPRLRRPPGRLRAGSLRTSTDWFRTGAFRGAGSSWEGRSGTRSSSAC
jgi:hypothetical protein